MGLYQGVFLVVASMLGTGILTTTGLMAAAFPSPWMILGVWIAGGGFALLGAYCYGVLISHHPLSGGEATIFRRFYSRSIGDVTGLLSFFIGFAASNAATALALAAYLKSGFHWMGLPSSDIPSQVIAISAIMLMTGIHATKDNRGLRFQTGIATLKFLMLFGLAIYSLFHITFLSSNLTHNLVQSANSSEQPSSSVFLWVIFAYSGWNAAIYSAGEFLSPRRTVPRAMMIGASLVVVLYIALNVALLGNFSTNELAGVVPVVGLLATRVIGDGMGGVFSLLVAIALLSSIGVSSFAGPRVLQAVLEQPSLESPPRKTVPAKLVWLQGGISALFILTGTFEQILSVMGLFLGIFPVIAVLALYRSRHWEDAKPPRRARYIAAPLFLIISTSVLAISTWEQPRTSGLVWGMVACFILWQTTRQWLQQRQNKAITKK